MFQEVCSIELFTNVRAKSFVINQHTIFIVKAENQFFAYLNRCPHQGIPLDWDNDQFLDIDEELIQCATHGAMFDIQTGLCLSGPCGGDKLTSVPLEIRSNSIYVKLT